MLNIPLADETTGPAMAWPFLFFAYNVAPATEDAKTDPVIAVVSIGTGEIPWSLVQQNNKDTAARDTVPHRKNPFLNIKKASSLEVLKKMKGVSPQTLEFIKICNTHASIPNNENRKTV
jgi:hypothetical protein